MVTATFTSPVSFQTVNVYFGDDALLLQPEERIVSAFADARVNSGTIFDSTPFPYFNDVRIGGISSVSPLQVANADFGTDLSHSIAGIGSQTFAPQPLIEVDLPGPSSQTVLSGTPSNDTLQGNAADNVLAGGRGHDVLTGAAGSDTFVFNTGDDKDLIADFDTRGREHDAIDLTLSPVDNFADLKDLTHQRGDDLVINFGHGDSLILRDHSFDDLNRWDIIL